jgi:integrase
MAWKKMMDRQGKAWFQFRFYNPTTKRSEPIPKEKTEHIRTAAEADEFNRIYSTGLNSTKLRIEMKLAWKSKHHNLMQLRKKFEKSRKEDAPNTWKGSMMYFDQYIVPFFAEVKECNNINNWSLYFEDFKEHLLKVKKVKAASMGRNETLAYNTRNHIINTLNKFLEYMSKIRECEVQPKMSNFPDHLMNVRTVEDIYSPEEYSAVVDWLQEHDPAVAELFIVLRHTGLRINEAFGLSMNDILDDVPDLESLKRGLETFNIHAHGHIWLRTQPLLASIRTPTEFKDRFGKVWTAGSVPRKDLKHKDKKTEDHKHRYIPIENTAAWNILVGRYEEQSDLLEQKVHGKLLPDYLLFDGLYYQRVWKSVNAACEAVRIPIKSPHCLRHTFATELAEKTLGNAMMIGTILGHMDQETTAKYMHLAGLLRKRKAVSDAVKSKGLKRVKAVGNK